MQMEDFSSREDKAIWAAGMIFLSILGAVVFWIQFRPERGELLHLDNDIYEEIKNKFPNHLTEIDSALEMSSYKRFNLEQWYGKKSPSELITSYKRGSKDIGPGCFGVLLAVLTSRQIEI